MKNEPGLVQFIKTYCSLIEVFIPVKNKIKISKATNSMDYFILNLLIIQTLIECLLLANIAKDHGE